MLTGVANAGNADRGSAFGASPDRKCSNMLGANEHTGSPIVCCMTQTDSLWTFEIEGPGYPGGYYTPAEEWSHADAAARWLVRALHDFGAIGGDKDAETERRSRQLAPLIEQVTGTHTWVEGGHTVTVMHVQRSASVPHKMGSMAVRRQVRQRQRAAQISSN